MAIAEILAEQRAFSAGEVSPALRNRRDLSRHQLAAERIENLIPLLEGGLTRCPGTQFVLPLRNEAERGRLIPFRFSVDDAYMLAFNDRTMRVLRDGGYIPDFSDPEEPPLDVETPFTEETLPTLRHAQSFDTLFVAWTGRPKIIRRLAAGDDWEIVNYRPTVGPVDPQNLDESVTLQASAETGAVTITTSEEDLITDADVGTTWRLDEPDLDLVPLWEAGETDLALNEERRWNGNVYRVSNIGTGGGQGKAGNNPPTHTKGVVQAGKNKVKWRFLHRGYGTVRITGITDGTTATAQVTSRLPKGVVDGGTYRWWPSAWSDGKGWPTAVAMHQGRLWWFRGDQYWPTKVNDLFSFDATLTDEGSFPGTLRSPDGSLVDVQWALSGGVLVLGVRDGEWLLRASNPMDPITLTDFLPLPDGTEGSAPHVPALVDGGAIFIGRSRKRLHSLIFDREAERLEPDEISLAARHLLALKAATIAYQRDPNRLIWVADLAGRLASFTYLPKEEVIAAARRPIDGQVEDIAALPSADGSVTELYLIVRRTIAGQTRRYIERLMPFFEPEDPDDPRAAGAWFVDCGLLYTAEEPFDSVTGLGHLEGREVAINLDDFEHPRKTVVGGSISFDRPTRKALVGLPLPWRVRTLPIEIELRTGSTKGRPKRATHAIIDMVESLGGMVRVNDGEASPLFETGGAGYGLPLALHTGLVEVGLEAASAMEATVEVFGDGTLPFTLTGIAPNLDIVEG